MSASLVGSEMCIRDRSKRARPRCRRSASDGSAGRLAGLAARASAGPSSCLLYTSDAADDM
eukprot:8538601-Alexandrium_andersonii.AAC.1